MDVSKRTVVVVGQNNAGRRALQLALNLEGYGVHAADSPEEGWTLIDKHWPEAVVLDVADDSPEVLSLVRDLRKNPHHRHVVIVAAAPLPLAAQERAAYEAGCDAFMVSPGQSRELTELLECYIPVGRCVSLPEMAIPEALELVPAFDGRLPRKREGLRTSRDALRAAKPRCALRDHDLEPFVDTDPGLLRSWCCRARGGTNRRLSDERETGRELLLRVASRGRRCFATACRGMRRRDPAPAAGGARGRWRPWRRSRRAPCRAAYPVRVRAPRMQKHRRRWRCPGRSRSVDRRCGGRPRRPSPWCCSRTSSVRICSRVETTLAALEAAYPGKIRVVWKNFPLDFHVNARAAARAALAAGEQGKFWEMQSRLLAAQQQLAPADLEQHAQALGLDLARFRTSLASAATDEVVEADLRQGRTLGVTGTPALFINRRKLMGAQPLAVMKAAVDEELARMAGGPR